MNPYTMDMTHFTTPLAYRRRMARTVLVGSVAVGGRHPIRVQSMLTCATWDVDAVLREMAPLQQAGCEIVRITVPTRKDLQALPEIRRRMAVEGITMPLVADIHFNPALALGCVPHVDKVRINPGNYADDKKFHRREYSAAEYAAELQRVEETLRPLLEALKTHGRALRVGVNHGSLSDRILNRYGDTPQGMVECAMEFLRSCARHDYHEIIVSMKSSNPLVVIQAYRLLVLAMAAEGMDYPLHLGVTEAGDGAEGRTKSAIGIGALLCDGLGDTIRVSLTEPAENEIPAARGLLEALEPFRRASAWPEEMHKAPISFARRRTDSVVVNSCLVGGEHPVPLIGLGKQGAAFRFSFSESTGSEGNSTFDTLLSPGAMNAEEDEASRPTLPQGDSGDAAGEFGRLGPTVILLGEESLRPGWLERLRAAQPSSPGSLLLCYQGEHPLYALRHMVGCLGQASLDWPLGVALPENSDTASGIIAPGLAAQIGSLAADGVLEALLCPGTDPAAPLAQACKVLLQAARLRTYATEYISCPSCGRTLFDLQETTARIKAHTSHLIGVKIGIMGCIVNGPGEMADADFGYVGGAPGRINLYKGQECVARGVPVDQAVERLLGMIRQHGRWVEPPGA